MISKNDNVVVDPQRGDHVIIRVLAHDRLGVVEGRTLRGRVNVRIIWGDEWDDDPNIEPNIAMCWPHELTWAPGHPKR